MKAGWKTTEWWTLLIGWVVAGLSIFGVITPDDAEGFMASLSKGITATALCSMLTWLTHRYFKLRAKLKNQPAPGLSAQASHSSPQLPLVLAVLLLLPALAPAQYRAPRVTEDQRPIGTIYQQSCAPTGYICGPNGCTRIGPQQVQQPTHTSTNFRVSAPTYEVAKQVADLAEQYRKEKAIEWLGRELPNWKGPCPVQVRVTMGGHGGATTFAFDGRGGYGQAMVVEGPLDKIYASVLPHEVTHTVFAATFACPLPRWCDEGGAVLSENDAERTKHAQLAQAYLEQKRTMPLRRLFALREYPDDVMLLYAQGFSVTDYLVSKSSKPKFLQFVRDGMEGPASWDRALAKHYGYPNIEALEKEWVSYCWWWGRRQNPQPSIVPVQPPAVSVPPSPSMPPGAGPVPSPGPAPTSSELTALRSEMADIRGELRGLRDGLLTGNPQLDDRLNRIEVKMNALDAKLNGAMSKVPDVSPLSTRLDSLESKLNNLSGSLRIRVQPK